MTNDASRSLLSTVLAMHFTSATADEVALITIMSEPEGTGASPAGDKEQNASEPEVPICALAPEANLQEERSSQISANPALQCLEEFR
ncbi:hypothetical protein NFI96_007261 [Prochilodus magdalenae]|nr:hypothetical protein NFI96_007261 [Prochilodus magdalenae]